MISSAVFLDRDGVIIQDSVNYIKSVEEVKILDGVFEAIKKLNEAKFKVIVITNQSVINRGKTSIDKVEEIHNFLLEECKKNHCNIDSFYYCPHRPDENCNCRKPKTGLFLKAAKEHGIELNLSWMIGDKDIDIAAGNSAGCRTMKIETNSKGLEHVVDEIIKQNNIQVIILAGGLGTRLGSLTKNTPKSLIRVGDKPFLQYQIELLKKSAFHNYVLCVGHLSEQIIQYFGNGNRFGVDIKYSIEKEQLGTGGALKNAWQILEDDFIVVNGDTFLRLDFRDAFRFHKNNGADITMVITQVNDTARFGKVIMDGQCRITTFSNDSSGEGFINAGVYFARKASINWNDLSPKFSFERDFLPFFVSNKKVYGYIYQGEFIDIGVPESLKQFELIADWL